jgi:hypothetical protein
MKEITTDEEKIRQVKIKLIRQLKRLQKEYGFETTVKGFNEIADMKFRITYEGQEK